MCNPRFRRHLITVVIDSLSVFTPQLLNPLQRTNTYLNIYYYPGLWSYTSLSSHVHLLRDRRSRWASHPVLKARTQGSVSFPREPCGRGRGALLLLLGLPSAGGMLCFSNPRRQHAAQYSEESDGYFDLLLGSFAPVRDTVHPVFQTGPLVAVLNARASCHPPRERLSK